MEGYVLILLTASAVITSTISAIVGMGGGILLLAIMIIVEPNLMIVVPLHGAIQLTSNATRVMAFRRHLVSWISTSFFFGSIGGALLAALFLHWIQGIEMRGIDPWFKLIIALYVLAMLFRSKKKKGGYQVKKIGFAILGVVITPISTLVGATGPLVAPFFIRDDLKKEEIVVNKASCQVVTHVFKLLVFSGVTVFSFTEHANALISLMIAAVVGTYIGKYLTQYVNEELFRKLYTAALLIAGLKILFFDALKPLLFC